MVHFQSWTILPVYDDSHYTSQKFASQICTIFKQSADIVSFLSIIQMCIIHVWSFKKQCVSGVGGIKNMVRNFFC